MANKRLYILRHAKSDWGNSGVDDIDRPLNERGKKDAPFMARKLKNSGLNVEHIISSHAKRAYDTARIMADEFPEACLEKEFQLYHADIDEIFHICLEIEEPKDNVMLVCHNPGITYFANVICGANVDNVPTCGILVIDVDTELWSEADMSDFKLIHFLYPKMKDE